MQPITNLSTMAIANTIRNKEISSTEVVDSFLNRIKAVNPKLNAVVQLAEETARDEASKADEALRRGETPGPLHGVPITIKDSFDTAGLISTGGTLGRARYIPPEEATVVSRFRFSGAILMRKTNTSELTLTYETKNLIYGQTNYPYDLARSPGGSSGGAAAIVAAGGSAFDIGSDYGGSLRFPSHCCGLATIKPTSGRVPRTGHILPFGGLFGSFQQVGPISRSVEDLSLILPIIAGPDHIDPSIVPMPLNNPENVDLKDLEVAFHADNGIISPSPETKEVIRRAASLLDDLGLRIYEKRPTGIEQTCELMIELLSADGGASIRRLLRNAGTMENTLHWLELAEPIGSTEFNARIMKLSRFQSTMLSFLKDYDIIISPVNAFPAMPHGSLGADLEAFSYAMTYT